MKRVHLYKLLSQPSLVSLVAIHGILIFFAYFARREKQSLERYLKDVPTVEEHEKLNKTISLKYCKFIQNGFTRFSSCR